MWLDRMFLICALPVLVTSEKRDRGSRKPRLFTFNTVNEDVIVNLDISIPFLTIPSKKAMNAMFGGGQSDLPSINVNSAALAVGGAIIIGTTVLIPLVLKSFVAHHPYEKYSRLLESTEFSTDGVLDFASQILTDSQAIRGCALRIACWTTQRSTKTDPMRIWSQLSSNNLLSTVINSTTIEDAMLSGRNGRDCMTYSPCPLREEHLPFLLGNLAAIANSVM